MANLEKHKKNLSLEWMDPEESTLPARSRGSHVLGAHAKTPKTVSRAVRRAAPAKPEPALAREPAPPKVEEKHSPATSPEHWRKLQRLPKLRAPFSQRSAKPTPGARG